MRSLSDFLYVISDFFFPLFHFFFLFGQNDPVVLIVILVAVSLEEILEHVSHGTVLRSLIESQVSALAQILGELDWIAFAEHFDRGGQFLFLDAFILVTLVVSLESLPRKHASQEIHDQIADALHVVSAG